MTLFFFFITLIFSSFSFAETPEELSFENKLFQCMGCHGIADYRIGFPSHYHVPLLGGQNKAYIVSALTAYHDQTRAYKTMRAVAFPLSESDMNLLAEHYAVELKSGEMVLDSSIEKGLALYKQYQCFVCHGDTGALVQDKFPILAGQYADYLSQAMSDYKTGQRDNAIMSIQMQKLSQEDMHEIAQFLSKQKGLFLRQ